MLNTFVNHDRIECMNVVRQMSNIKYHVIWHGTKSTPTQIDLQLTTEMKLSVLSVMQPLAHFFVLLMFRHHIRLKLIILAYKNQPTV